MRTGDGYFIPAGYGEYALKGDMEIVVTKISKKTRQLSGKSQMRQKALTKTIFMIKYK